MLKELRLTEIAKAWPALASKATKEAWEPELFLAELCELEVNHRVENRLKRLLKESKLPIGKQLKQKVTQLEWIKQGHNVLLFGASGLEKTHLAAALGYALLAQSIRVKFITGTALVQQLQKAREALGLEDALKKLDKYELLILDDIGYVKKSDSESQVLFELIAHRYERNSLLITTNQAFSDGTVYLGTI